MVLSNRKKIILSTVFIIIIAITLFVLFGHSQPKDSGESTINTSPTSAQNSPSSDTTPTTTSAIKNGKSSEVQFIDLKKQVGEISSDYKKIFGSSFMYDKENKKYSPSDTEMARINARHLEIYDENSPQLKASFKLEDSTGQVNFAWVTDTILVIFEKNYEQDKTDDIYAADVNTGRKTLLTHTTQIVSHLNLDEEPTVYKNGRTYGVTLLDNDAYYWLLEFSVK
jgi:hypothetical protein